MGHGSLATLRVLRAFLDEPASEHYGLDLIECSGVGAGSLYPILSRLEHDGWLAGSWEQIDEHEEGRRRRRYYRLTAVGEVQARALLIETARSLLPPEARRAPEAGWALA